MSDGEKAPGMGAGKIVLIVIAVLVGLGILCCVGGWFMGGNIAYKLTKPNIVMHQRMTAKYGADATAMALPDQGGKDFVIVATVNLDLTPEKVTEVQDEAWRAYVDAFSDGGVGVRRIAVARSGSATPDWKSNTVDAEEVAARTGRPAPPDAEWLDTFRKSGKGKLEVEVKTDAPAEDGPK